MLFSDLKAADYRSPTVALFWSTNCAPCERLKPRLREVCAKLGLRLEEFFLPDNLAAARELGLRTVPSVLVVHKGVVTPAFSGLVDDIAGKLAAAGAVPK